MKQKLTDSKNQMRDILKKIVTYPVYLISLLSINKYINKMDIHNHC